MRRLSKILRLLGGLEDGQPWSSFRVAVLGFLGLIVLVLVLELATGTPLHCVVSGACR